MDDEIEQRVGQPAIEPFSFSVIYGVVLGFAAEDKEVSSSMYS